MSSDSRFQYHLFVWDVQLKKKFDAGRVLSNGAIMVWWARSYFDLGARFDCYHRPYVPPR
jgi:hypothetical protein